MRDKAIIAAGLLGPGNGRQDGIDYTLGMIYLLRGEDHRARETSTRRN